MTLRLLFRLVSCLLAVMKYVSPFCLLYSMCLHYVSPLCLLFAKRLYGGVDLLSYGEWAVITGASDGIGRALASQLAKRGFKKILLIARNDNKLKDVATELELVAPTPVKVSRLIIDFAAESAEEIFKKVSEAVKGQQIEMKARKKGLIVCVGSGASELPSDPLYAAYAATKGASEAFCRSLQVCCNGIEVYEQGSQLLPPHSVSALVACSSTLCLQSASSEGVG
ncbi:3-ketoacyl-CoA reductase, putative [Eimeria acervulina]|uniref:3-ketoacyl-CoA reductase, putative n=1 Tax=Eimeria acervulina TaxID=5801 RepID=U6GAS8_EIMAC|nr:3-ketoacyl-CoA reductase, putative [Eimeria acervulina]CDI76443.1 3-ketoacyl-CoA reductase, putative [Eimeria acervulina]